MKKIRVNTPRPYDILIGKNLSLKLISYLKKINPGNYALVLTNKTIYKTFKDKIKYIFPKNKSIEFEFKVLPDTEKIKSLFYLTRILNKLGSLNFQKKPFLICWGGGVIGDLGGFSSAIYKRGIIYIQLPTTLLSQIDSSIGGKTGIDLNSGKNLAGSFWQPSLVLSDLSFLKTLKSGQIKEGLSEAIKYGLISDKKLFKFIEENYSAIFKKNLQILETLVSWCSRIKKEIVEKDEREEKGLRTILNFGHTFAHALEAASGYKLSHGKAVALGIIAAINLSRRISLLKDEKISFQINALFRKIGLPTRIFSLRKDYILEAMKKDKKFINRKTRFVLLEKPEKPVIKEEIPRILIIEALREIVSID